MCVAPQASCHGDFQQVAVAVVLRVAYYEQEQDGFVLGQEHWQEYVIDVSAME